MNFKMIVSVGLIILLNIITQCYCHKPILHNAEFDTNPSEIIDNDWDLLAKEWVKYLKTPNEKTALKIISLLPDVLPSRDEENDFSAYYSVSENIRKDLTKFIPIMKKGQAHSLKLLFKLLNIENIRDTFPYEEFGLIITKYPLIFLKELKQSKAYQNKDNFPVHYLATYDLDTTGLVKKEIKNAEQRINALISVSDEDIIEIRDQCVDKLREEIQYYKDRGEIPTNLEECYVRLKEIFLEEGALEEFIRCYRKGGNGCPIYHMGLGMWMRNNWGLWKENTKLWQFFNQKGIFHADDMSGIIFESFWRYLNNKPINLNEQVSYYIKYWKYNLPPDKESFPVKDLRVLGSQDCDPPDDNDYCSIHVYKDDITGEIWLYRVDKGWFKADKKFLEENPTWLQ